MAGAEWTTYYILYIMQKHYRSSHQRVSAIYYEMQNVDGVYFRHFSYEPGSPSLSPLNKWKTTLKTTFFVPKNIYPLFGVYMYISKLQLYWVSYSLVYIDMWQLRIYYLYEFLSNMLNPVSCNSSFYWIQRILPDMWKQIIVKTN